ncbi:MAG: DUF4224 domain-containing protein [Betaproteobacteria bacterium]
MTSANVPPPIPVFLSEEELVELTGYRRYSRQAARLRNIGWTFIVNAADRPILSRAYVDQQLGLTGAHGASDRGSYSRIPPNWAALNTPSRVKRGAR